jgi:phage terminase large subunit-like protein
MFTLEGWKRGEHGLLLPPGEITLTLAGLRFAHFCRSFIVHTKGRWARKPLELEPWQLAMFSEVFRTEPCNTFIFDPEMLADPWEIIEEIVERPWFDVVTGTRVYREAYIQMPEKTGKSTLMSAVQMYGLAWDGEDGSEVYTAATSTDQARIVFGQAQQTIKRSPSLQTMVRHGMLKVYADAIYHPETDSVFRVLSSEDAHNEGLNPHLVCLDELWAHKTRALYDTLTSRIHSGTRTDPMAFAITNAGDDSEGICHEVYRQAIAVIKGEPDARSDLFAFVPELAKENIDKPEHWLEVNPQSYMTVDLLMAAKAKQPPFVFRRRRLNVWTDTADSWLDPDEYRLLVEGHRLDGLTFECDPEREDYLYLGIDLGLKRDTAAVGMCAPRSDGLLETWCHVWGLPNPETGEWPACHERVDDTRLPISLVEAYIEDLARQGWVIAGIAYDPYRFERSAQTLAETFYVMEFPQTDTNMIPATEDLYQDVKDARIIVPDDDVMERHWLAGVAKETGRGYRLTKRDGGKTQRPNDGLIADAMACALARDASATSRPTVSAVL